ncbi:MAG: hypothetical protein WBN53_17450 [Thermodesulfobacteriota bacterium]
MRKTIIALFCLILATGALADAAQKDLEIQGKKLVSQKPVFTLTLPSELNLVYSFSHENPGENSLTRVYFLARTKGKQVEEMLILQIADRTGASVGPMTVPPLRPYTEKRMFLKDRVKKAGVTIDYLIQLMAWNPDAHSLQPMVKKGIIIPPHWALQGQFQFVYQGEHAVSIRYSRDVNSFEMKVSDAGDGWEKGSISGNEKRIYEVFQKTFTEIIDTLRTITP